MYPIKSPPHASLLLGLSNYQSQLNQKLNTGSLLIQHQQSGHSLGPGSNNPSSLINSSPNKHLNNFVSFTQPPQEWTTETVSQWLAINNLSIYIDSFAERMIDGEKLLSLDTAKLKSLGVKSQKDREHLKARIKELRVDDKKRAKFIQTGLDPMLKKKKLKA
jgi:hypothetical protein